MKSQVATVTNLDARSRADIREQQARRLKRTCIRWGLSPEEYVEHVRRWGNCTDLGSPMQRYNAQRTSARKRGIAWHFTFAQWWAVWAASGKWSERGGGLGYVMGRKGDVGPYAADNVYICTSGQNTADSFVAKPWRERHPKGWTERVGKGWRHRPDCVERPYQAYLGNRSLGFFKTSEEARQAYLAAKFPSDGGAPHQRQTP